LAAGQIGWGWVLKSQAVKAEINQDPLFESNRLTLGKWITTGTDSS